MPCAGNLHLKCACSQIQALPTRHSSQEAAPLPDFLEENVSGNIQADGAFGSSKAGDNG